MGKVYIVPTPIGNIDDLSKRAIDILSKVESIYAEDTRHSKHFLDTYSIKNKLLSLHKFNESEREEKILSDLVLGDIAIISDAGTPTISDPGQFIIKKLIEHDIEIVALPGATAITTALSSSGLIYKTFMFSGFAEKTKKKLEKQIISAGESDVLVLYEVSTRINKTLQNLFEIIGNAEVVISKELTKKFEEITRGNISDVSNKTYKGEIVLLINLKTANLVQEIDKMIFDLKEEGMTDKSIATFLSKHTNKTKNDIYNKLKNKPIF